ncbi:uncharacterized protein LOC108959574 [Eucalyptus grandis]|uniref:uncharacterized protein LOC108959574 n=1 Tax=Eucalyptus grandis TaxID=71139 RepID=UPI00192E75F2|nr:uncharacterized protein LOC108959574 [Eucalyptus grandis]
MRLEQALGLRMSLRHTMMRTRQVMTLAGGICFPPFPPLQAPPPHGLRGLGNSLTVHALKAMPAKEKPNLVFLMETKNSAVKLTDIQRRLHFTNAYVINPVGLAGGLAVLWNDQVLNDCALMELESKGCRFTWMNNREGDELVLKAMTSTYFAELYTTVGYRDYGPVLAQCPQVVTAEMNAKLLESISLEEVRQATFQLGTNKAPGPDGFNGLFYQTHWEVIKSDLHLLVQNFFGSGRLPTNLNQTVIALIPKTPHPESLDQYRPISLCNFAYKIISKVLANRLKPWLPNLISMEQSAFMNGRQIQDNILVVQEVIHQFKTRKRTSKFHAILKTDMKKAYDRVEWDFLNAYLLRLGFHPRWVHLILQCITTTSYSVRFNGELLPFFHPTRGLRQGDPLSPYIFILLANVFSTMISQAVDMGQLKGIKLNRWCPTLSHLFFADDAMFFLDANIMECQNLANILNQYCMATGQALNRNKSGIIFSKNCPFGLQENLASEFRVPVLQNYGKYLGIPSDWGRSKKEMFSWLLGRVQAKLEGWKEKFISKGGKEILIKSVIQAIPHYAMSIFKLPLSLCKTIEKSIARFWWKNDQNKAGIHWKRWEILRKSKNEGGLGFRDLVEFNKAMLGKQAWRLLQQPQALWSKIFKGLYYHSTDFQSANRGSRPSWGWQSLLVGRDAIIPHVRWSVGDGRQIRIREDCWLPRGVIGGPAAREEPQLVADLIDPIHNSWNTSLLTSFLDDQIVAEVLTIPVRPTLVDDQLVWTANKDGRHTVKSNYHALNSVNRTPNNSTASTSYRHPMILWKKIWTMRTVPKLRIFLWSVCQNAIASKDNLYRRHISSEPFCQINIDIQLSSVTRIEVWLTEKAESPNNSPALELIANVLWQIWRMRNSFIFRGDRPNPSLAAENALSQTRLYEVSLSSSSSRSTGKKQHSQIWHPPPPGTLKCNIDASFQPGSTHGSMASICRDQYGRLTDVYTAQFPATSALIAEFQALTFAVRHLLHQGLHQAPIMLESDCSTVVAAVTGEELPPWEARVLLAEATDSLSIFPNLVVRFCKREGNAVADWAAKAQLFNFSAQDWNIYPPYLLLDLVYADALASGCKLSKF